METSSNSWDFSGIPRLAHAIMFHAIHTAGYYLHDLKFDRHHDSAESYSILTPKSAAWASLASDPMYRDILKYRCETLGGKAVPCSRTLNDMLNRLSVDGKSTDVEVICDVLSTVAYLTASPNIIDDMPNSRWYQLRFYPSLCWRDRVVPSQLILGGTFISGLLSAFTIMLASYPAVLPVKSSVRRGEIFQSNMTLSYDLYDALSAYVLWLQNYFPDVVFEHRESATHTFYTPNALGFDSLDELENELEGLPMMQRLASRILSLGFPASDSTSRGLYAGCVVKFCDAMMVYLNPRSKGFMDASITSPAAIFGVITGDRILDATSYDINNVAQIGELKLGNYTLSDYAFRTFVTASDDSNPTLCPFDVDGLALLAFALAGDVRTCLRYIVTQAGGLSRVICGSDLFARIDAGVDESVRLFRQLNDESIHVDVIPLSQTSMPTINGEFIIKSTTELSGFRSLAYYDPSKTLNSGKSITHGEDMYADAAKFWNVVIKTMRPAFRPMTVDSFQSAYMLVIRNQKWPTGIGYGLVLGTRCIPLTAVQSILERATPRHMHTPTARPLAPEPDWDTWLSEWDRATTFVSDRPSKNTHDMVKGKVGRYASPQRQLTSSGLPIILQFDPPTTHVRRDGDNHLSSRHDNV